jgi:Sap, sulfolipid-1-addressing protein
MWGTVLLLGLWTAPDPVRIGIAVLLVSRRRPMANLFAFWLGGMVAGIGFGLVALLLLRDSLPAMIHAVSSTLAVWTGGNVKIVIGVLALMVAGVTAARMAVQRGQVPVASGAPSLVAPQPVATNAFSRLVARVQRLLEGGHPWVSFAAGLNQATPWVEYLMAFSIIAASGAALGAQLCAVTLFTVAIFAFVELPLICYLVKPARTEAIVLSVHNWLVAQRRRILVGGAALLGVFMLASGIGGA